MADNKRVFWACTGVSFCTHGLVLTDGLVDTTGCTVAYGVQSVGITTSFNLEQVFELGQIQIYEDVEEVPDIEVTMEKVLDGEPLLYDLATGVDHTVGASVDMVLEARARKDVWMTIQDETNDDLIRTGTSVYCSGMYVSSFSYTLPNEGNCTEAITLVGNDKLWKGNSWSAPDARMGAHLIRAGTDTWETADFGVDATADTPGHVTGVQRRENVRLNVSVLPRDIFGVDSDQDPGNANREWVHINSITMSGDLGREAINELGTKLPYYRYVTFPVEVSTDIEVTTISGDLVDAGSHKDNLTNERIYIVLDDTTEFDLGTKNKLQSVTYTGGSTGGENATCTYSFLGFNKFVINGPA